SPVSAHAGGDHLAELQPRRALRDGLQIVRIVVLPVHENDLFRAARDVQLPAVHQAEVTGAQPAVGGEGGGIRLRVFVVAARDVGPRHVHVTDPILGQLAVLIVRDAYTAVGNGLALAHESHGVRV